jgi:hypothetical protein
MAYTIEGRDIVINGFENGIADAPEAGISDMRNMNIISIPKEAAVSFATTSYTLPSVATTFTVTSLANDEIQQLSATEVTTGTAVTFTTTGTLPAGLSLATTYWLAPGITANTNRVYTTIGTSIGGLVNITDNGTGTHTMTSINMGRPMHFDRSNGVVGSGSFLIDNNGRAWSNIPGGAGNWCFLGNTTLTNASGNGIVFYTGSDGLQWLFVFRNQLIDYCQWGSAITWVYAWDPPNGTAGTGYVLNTAAGTNNPHDALVGYDNTVYFTDGSYLGSFFEKLGNNFNPASSSTYTSAKKAANLPKFDVSICIAELGKNLLIGAQRNFIYSWDRISTGLSVPIQIAESFTSTMVTANTNVYIFAGNRGRVYVTNGSQANLLLKMPDHLSDTVEPYFTWGGATYLKNNVIFGVKATDNAGNAINNYGGVWAFNLDNNALRCLNQLSYGTYSGYASAMANVTTSYLGNNPAGFGFYAGWDSGSSTYGVDATSSTPYTNYQSYIDTDLIPIGLFLQKRTLENIEFKLAAKLVSGEGVKISYRTNITEAFTLIGETTTVGALSDVYPPNFENVQWIQLRIQTKSTGSTPSYVRLTEVRLR